MRIRAELLYTEPVASASDLKISDTNGRSNLVASVSTPPSPLPSDDIPAARRQSSQSDSTPATRRRGRWAAPSSRFRMVCLIGLGIGLACLIGLGILKGDTLADTLIAKARVIPDTVLPRKDASAAGDRSSSASTSLSATPATNTEPTAPELLLHHRRYAVARSEDLVPLNPKSQIRLQPAAQAQIVAMIAKAKSEGVQLGIISGFRSLEDQQYLFFDVKAERGETSTARAEVSAPPGYSEHHTGYAVDFIDESKPATHLEESFETTVAYQWLEKNAAFYNFEMSFSKDPASPLSYEPWHWRYVGDQKSLELFYKE